MNPRYRTPLATSPLGLPGPADGREGVCSWVPAPRPPLALSAVPPVGGRKQRQHPRGVQVLHGVAWQGLGQNGFGRRRVGLQEDRHHPAPEREDKEPDHLEQQAPLAVYGGAQHPERDEPDAH
jgi:hypothetical protein